MKVGEYFRGKYVTADDLGDAEVVVEIASFKPEQNEFDGEVKTAPVLFFKGMSRGLWLNKTNFSRIVEAIGTDESSVWVGWKFSLHAVLVEYKGDEVKGVRIKKGSFVAPPKKEKGAPETESESGGVKF